MEKHFIVRMNIRLSNSTVLLIFDKKTKNLIGHLFPNKQFSKLKILELMNETFPPDFDSIGEYGIKLKNRIDYLILDKNNNPDEINEIQTTLNIL